MLIPTCIIKLFELMLAISCLTLHHYSYDMTDVPTLMLCSGTYIGFVVVLSGEIVGEAVSAAADAYIDAWWSASGGVLFGACGAATLHHWRDIPESDRRTYAQAAAVCALAATALFVIDALLAIVSANSSGSSYRTKSHRTGNPCS